MADFQRIVYQMILSVLRGAKMTSKDPTFTNVFKGMGSPDVGFDEELKEAIRETVDGFIVDPDSPDKLAENLLDAEEKEKNKKGTKEKTAAKAIGKTIGVGKDPVAAIIATAIPFLPHAVLVTLAIMLVPLIFKELTRPGAALDLRFKRIVDDEINAFLSRQTQKDTEMGIRQVIIQSKKGFTAANGVNNYNTTKDIREGGFDKERLDRQGRVDHSKGVFDFG